MKILKKLLPLMLACTLVLCGSFSAYGAQTAPSSEDLEKQIASTAAYLTKGVASYTVDDAVNLFYLAGSGADIANTDSFIASVKDNLSANGGKIVSSYGENITTYAAVIQVLLELGENPSDFNGYDIVSTFSQQDFTAKLDNPYYYNIVIPATFYCEDETLGKKSCDSLVANYYTAGSGMDYYGFSCDNTAYMISALSNYYDDYKEIVDDCIAVLDGYRVNGGYCYNTAYGTDPNGDSTALALMAYSAYYLCTLDFEQGSNPTKEKCDSIYADLMSFKGSEDGVFTYMKDGDNAYATADALRGLASYSDAVFVYELINMPEDDGDGDDITDITIEENTKPTDTTEKKTEAEAAAVKKSPATSAPSAAGIAAASAFFTAALAVALRKRTTK